VREVMRGFFVLVGRGEGDRGVGMAGWDGWLVPWTDAVMVEGNM
jgi:hypothetical protein